MANRYFKSTLLMASAAAMVMSTPAYAMKLNEIVVTAQKKEENLQDVPIAITAFDEAMLQANRVEGLEDVAAVTPSIYVTPNPADNNGVRVYIRGMGTFDPQMGQDSRVAIYNDGVYMGKTQGLAFDLPDMSRLEVLKGPQGTLYGRNTIAGAINLISAKPDADALSGKLNAEYGSFNHMKFSGAVNVPVGENAAFRLSGLYLDREGWVENSGPGTDFGGETKTGIRAAFGVDMSDNFRLDLAADYNKTEKEPLFYQSFGPGAAPFAAAITPFNNGRQENVTTSFAPEKGDSETMGISAIGTWTPEFGGELKTTFGYREADSSRFVTLVPTANPATLNLIVGGFNGALGAMPFAFGVAAQPLRGDYATAFSGVPAERGLFLSQPGGSSTLEDHKQFSLEMTYNNEFADGKVEYTVGGFYYDEETGTGPGSPNLTNANDYLFVLAQFNPQVLAPNINAFLNSFDISPAPGLQTLPANARGPIPVAATLLAGLPGTAPQILQLVGDPAIHQAQCVNAFTPTPANNFCIPPLSVALAAARQSASNTLFIDTQAFALYGQATWHLTDNFRVTGGLRFSKEKKDGVGQAKSPFFNDNLDLAGNTILPNISSYDDDVIDPSLTLEYDFNEDVLLYASYKESYRAGGFNAAAIASRIPGQTFGRDFNFGREDLRAYEAGFKGTFGDSVRLNGAFFFYDLQNQQTTVALNPLIATSRAVVNVDEERYGFELDGEFAVSDNLTARVSYTHIDGEPGDPVNPETMAVEVRDELQGTPKNALSIGLDYNGTWKEKNLFGNIVYSYKDSTLAVYDAINNNHLRLPAVNLVNARLGIGFDVAEGREATLSVWGTNIFDEEYLIDTLPFETFAFRTKVFGQPQSFGVALGYKF